MIVGSIIGRHEPDTQVGFKRSDPSGEPMTTRAIRFLTIPLLSLALLAPATEAAAQNDKLSKKDFEIVVSAGLHVPDPLTPQSVETFVNEVLVTTQDGRLIVTKSIDLSATCTQGTGVLYYLMVDDVPVRSSAVFSRTGVTG